MTTQAEIIDLTSPKPAVHEILDSESELVEAPAAQPPASDEPRKKKTRRSKRASLNPSASTPVSRDSRASSRAGDAEPPNTEPRAKRKRQDESPSEATQENVAQPQSRRVRREMEREKAKEQKAEDGELDEGELFIIDLTPMPIPSLVASAVNAADATAEEITAKLLVPAHVTVLGSTPVEIIKPLDESEKDEDFINYLDYDDSKHMLRYYDEPKDESVVLNRTVCKNCGAEGDHKTSACTIQICLTCGLRNEHSTRSCPISKVCFTCGMKGHINANCPNRRTARAFQSSREVECDRCSSSNHKTNECPTVWRLYEYYTAEEQTHVIETRHSKKDLKLGEGGEGYVADDEWCYYCGHNGHWGDDCHDMDRAPDEPSAFSRYNVMTGPFYDPNNERKASTSRSQVRDWASVEDTSRWDKNAPGPVGRQGRMKSRAALERQAQQVEDDQDDWFRDRRSAPSNRGQQQKNGPKTTFNFGKNMGGGKQYAPPPTDAGRPSLLARLDLGRADGRDARSGHRSHKRDYQEDSSSGHRDRRRRDDRSSSYYSDRRNRDHGPRYRGGYEPR
ncbi:hypothetical protein HYPSUDRAFT_482111 [Hypholoma sublateritium FD-334 SS-4]|uniref:CCHC-type domain-containing protein n=1 Tax=Hypholoma sublateritium (strain FD-334 SS-4) TaxID=945553 RepID=A0A0D2P7P8_HYPSF|nr:hypothetical protein HYPSUDRAFT_482111 [Hypholoma sublateritium FD-334 SS-4]